MTTLGVLLVRFTRSNLTTNTYPRGCRSADLPASVQGLQHTSEHLVRKLCVPRRCSSRHNRRGTILNRRGPKFAVPNLSTALMGLIVSPTIYSITSPLEVISLMEIVVLCFVYTILTQLVFFFFSCCAEIFIVNRLLESQLHYQCPIVSTIDP